MAATVPPVPQAHQAIAPSASAFGREIEARAAQHPGQSGFRLLPASNEAFAARLELIHAARSSLDLQYYIVHDGLSTRLLFDELLRAADRGVRVRLLLDDTSSDGKDDEKSDPEIMSIFFHVSFSFRSKFCACGGR